MKILQEGKGITRGGLGGGVDGERGEELVDGICWGLGGWTRCACAVGFLFACAHGCVGSLGFPMFRGAGWECSIATTIDDA